MILEEMLRALEEENKKRCLEVIAEGKKEAAKIVQEAELEAERIKNKEIENVTSSLHGEKAKILNEARLFVKRQIVQAKEDIAQQAFSEAQKQLADFKKSKDYPAIFRHLLEETLENVEGKVIVTVEKSDEKMAQEILDELGLEYQLQSDTSFLGGVKVATADGRITLTNTFDARLENARRLLKPEIMSILFG